MRQNGQNFQFSKGPFFRNEWPYGYDFWHVFKYLCETFKIYNFATFLKIYQEL